MENPMKKLNIFLFLLLSLFLFSSVSADSKDFDSEKMLSDLEQQLQLSRDKYEQMKPELEQALEQKYVVREVVFSPDQQRIFFKLDPE